MSRLSDSPVKTNLPLPADFVGRERELEEVLKALGPIDRAWIISLTGVGGIGKTELALQAGHIVLKRQLFEYVVWITAKESWLTQEGIQPFETQYPLVSLDDLLDTIIEVLEMDPRLYRASPLRKKEAVKERLQSTSCLLIVDNLETVQDRAIIQFLTDEFPNPCKSLVTTRLGGLTASDAAVAQTLAGQRELRIGPLSQEDGITLFLRRAKKHGLQFSYEEHSAKLEDIINKTAGIPLAIEWIIGRMALKNDTLDDALAQFQTSNTEVLEYCFENLIKIVGPRPKKLLLAVSVFAESVSWDMLREITNIQPKSVDEALTRLVKASLIEQIPVGTSEWRYSVLAPTRLYVNSIRQDLADVYKEYCIKAAEKYVGLLQAAEQHQQWGSLRNEQHNILTIFSWCFENNEFKLAVKLAHVLSTYLQRLGFWDQRVRVCELATLAAKNLGDKQESTQFAYDAAEIHKARGRLAEAFKEFDECEKYSREIGDNTRAAHAHMQKGIILYHQERYNDSIRTLQRSLELHKANGDQQGVAQTLSILGRNQLKREDLDSALKYFEESLSIKRQMKVDQLGIAISLYDLAHLYHKMSDFQRSELLFKEALVILVDDRLDEKRHQSNAKWYLALLQIDLGNYDTAKNLLLDVISIEEPLQRDARLERARAKLIELEEADKATRPDSGNLALNQSSGDEKYINQDLAESVVALLIDYVSHDAEEFARDPHFAVYERIQRMLLLLKEAWNEDEEAADTLVRFAEKPKRYKAALEDILQEKLEADEYLATRLSQLVE